MEKPYDEVFESICDIKGHPFIADNDPTPEEPEDNLLKRCFFLDSLVMLIIPHSKFFKNYIVFDINYT